MRGIRGPNLGFTGRQLQECDMKLIRGTQRYAGGTVEMMKLQGLLYVEAGFDSYLNKEPFPG
jgi:hypothetical protein